MKFKAIAKASLALGMLATGVITSNTQSVRENRSKTTK